ETIFEHGGAWSEGYLEFVDQIFFPVIESVEGERVKRTMRDHHQMRCLDFRNERPQQIPVELVKMPSRRFQSLRRLGSLILGPQRELFELEAQPPLQIDDPAARAKTANDTCLIL